LIFSKKTKFPPSGTQLNFNSHNNLFQTLVFLVFGGVDVVVAEFLSDDFPGFAFVVEGLE